MTDPHYILEYMQDNDLRYFQVANQFNRDVVVSFNDRSLEDGIEKMRNLNENPDPKKENRGAKLNTLHRAEELLNKYSIEKIKSNPELKTQLVNLNNF